MRHIHPSFKTKKVLNFIGDLIVEYDYKEFSDLTEENKGELAALLSEACGRGDEFCFITESVNADQTINLFRQALHGTASDNQDFLFAIKNNAIEYYAYTMESLFNYVLDDYHAERNNWLEKIGHNLSEFAA